MKKVTAIAVPIMLDMKSNSPIASPIKENICRII